MTLGVVRSLGTARSLRSPQEIEDFEQELVDQYALATAEPAPPTATWRMTEQSSSIS